MTTTGNGQGYQEWEGDLPGKKELVSLFIRAPDLGFLKPLYSKARFFIFDPARKIGDTNPFSARQKYFQQYGYVQLSHQSLGQSLRLGIHFSFRTFLVGPNIRRDCMVLGEIQLG